MYKILLFLPMMFSAQVGITTTGARFTNLDTDRNTSINTFEAGIKSGEKDYWLFTEGQMSLMLVHDNSYVLSDTKTSLLVGATFTKKIYKYLGIDYGYYLGASLNKDQTVVETVKLGLSARNLMFNPLLQYMRVNNKSYLGIGCRIDLIK